jgi:hypothetical protein
MIVEVLHPRMGSVRARVRVTAIPFVIGRALDAALLLDDPHVDARHAQLELDESGALVLTDLGSVNGLYAAAHGRAVPGSVARLAVTSGTEVVLGRTRLRFRDEQDPVAAAVPLRSAIPQGTLRWHERSGARLAIIAAAVTWIGVGTWLGSDSRSGATDAVSLALGAFVLGALWAGIWAAVSRVVVHQARFAAHLTITFLAVLAFSAVGVAGTWVQFLYPAAAWWEGFAGALMLVAFAVLLQAHLAQATAMTARVRWRTALTGSVAVLVIAGVFALAEDDTFTDVPTFSGIIKSAPLSVVPAMPAGEFVSLLSELRDEVDSLAANTRD